MGKGYVISSVTVTDPVAYAQYAKGATLAIAKFGGRPLARGGRWEALEGEGRMRNVVLEFDSFDRAKEYYNSPEYQQALKLREGAAIMTMIVVEGV